MHSDGALANPCLRQCCLDENDICTGCLRSLAEITHWHKLTVDEKLEFKALLLKRQNIDKDLLHPMHNQKRRCFIAVNPPKEIRRQLDRHVLLFKEANPNVDLDFRWLPTGNRHLTLRFLGELESKQLIHLESLLKNEAWFKQAIEIYIERICRFPGKSKGGYIVAEAAPSSALMQLHKRLSDMLESFGVEKEHRAFRPHITLAKKRRNQPGSASANMQPLEAPIIFSIEEMALVESLLNPAGAQYRSLGFYR